MIRKFLSRIYRLLRSYMEKILDKKNDKKRKKFSNKIENFNSIELDTSNYISELCLLGEKYGTDKSVFNKNTKHQHSYTAIYNILFGSYKNKTINVAEFGVAHSSSLKMFRDFFKEANLFIFDHDDKALEKAKNLKLEKVDFFKLDVKNKNEIKYLFEKNGIDYDIIIDDSSHLFAHQINIILETKKFLKKDGFLIIEDIYINEKNYSENKYYEALKHLKSEFSDIFFCKCNHKYNYSGFWNNSKLLIFRK
jgi:hypothetical protein